MFCAICDRSIEHGANLYRLNTVGVEGRWSCEKHCRAFGDYARTTGKLFPLSDAEIDDCATRYLAENVRFKV